MIEVLTPDLLLGSTWNFEHKLSKVCSLKIAHKIFFDFLTHHNVHWEKNGIESIAFSFQRHVYHGFKSICYRISNIFIGSCSIFLWNHSIHAFRKKYFWFNSIFFSVHHSEIFTFEVVSMFNLLTIARYDWGCYSGSTAQIYLKFWT